MADKKDQPAARAMTEEQARQKLGLAELELFKKTRAVERQFSQTMMLAQDRLDFVKTELEKTNDQLEGLAAQRNHPDGEYAYAMTRFLAEIYASLQKMMEVDLDCHTYNMELLERPTGLANEAFRTPDRYLAYREAAARLDLSLAFFHWMQDAESIDVIMRAALNVRAVEPRSDEEHLRRQNAAKALREEFKTNRDMAMLTGAIAQGYAETLDLMEWGLAQLPGLEKGDPAAKRAILGEVNWAKLNGKVTTVMGEVSARVKDHPTLAELFPVPPQVLLPFALAAAPTGLGSVRYMPGPSGVPGPRQHMAVGGRPGLAAANAPITATEPARGTGPLVAPPGAPAASKKEPADSLTLTSREAPPKAVIPPKPTGGTPRPATPPVKIPPRPNTGPLAGKPAGGDGDDKRRL